MSFSLMIKLDFFFYLRICFFNITPGIKEKESYWAATQNLMMMISPRYMYACVYVCVFRYFSILFFCLWLSVHIKHCIIAELSPGYSSNDFYN